MTFGGRLAAVLAFTAIVGGGIAAGCGGTAPGAPGAGDVSAVGQAAGDRHFNREVAPFPGFDAEGQPYAHPFLGGFDVPRPHFADIDGDGDPDLFIQERTDRLIHLENVGEPGVPRFEWRTDHWRQLDVGEWARFHDLDDDGDLDLLAESPFSYVRYYRNDGTPVRPDMVLVTDSVRDVDGEPIFSDRQNIPSVSDIDCNGRPDLFLGRVDGTVTRYEMTGFASDGAPRFRLVAERFEDIEIVAQIGGDPVGPDAPDTGERPTRHGANSMAFVDWDGDGDPDLLWGDFFEPSVLLIENRGSCESPDLHSEPRPVETAVGDTLLTSGYNMPAPADLDTDGDEDLVIGVLGGAYNPATTAAANLPHWERTGEGGPLTRRTVDFLAQIDVGSESVPALGDIDGDGDLDLLVGNRIDPGSSQGGSIHLFENSGSPTAPEYRLTGTLSMGEAYHWAPRLADLDDDGDLDLITGTWQQGVLVYWNEGTPADPEFVRAESPLIMLERGSNTTPAMGDFDGDGDLDAVVGEAAGDLNFYRNVGSAAEPEFELMDVPVDEPLADVGRRSQPALFDWDGDGRLDLLVGREEAGLLLYLGDGDGGFTEAGAVLPDLLPYTAAAFGDVDGDGIADLMAGALGGGVVFMRGGGG